MLEKALSRVDAAVEGISEGPMNSLDDMARFCFTDAAIEEFLLVLARLPVFSNEFEELFKVKHRIRFVFVLHSVSIFLTHTPSFFIKENLDGLQILKKLKFFTNLKIRETLYLLVRLAAAFSGQEEDAEAASLDLLKFFSNINQSNQMERIVDLKFQSAIRRCALFPQDHPQYSKYMKEFDELEKVEPHAVYPTSIYRQSDGCTVATEDSLKIEAVMSTTLTTSIRISSHVLGFDNPLLAEIYRPLGRVVVVMDDKLCDVNYTRGDVELDTNKRAVLDMGSSSSSTSCFQMMSIKEQLERYFAFHNVETKILAKSGDEVSKDIESVQEILIDLKKLGVMRNEPVLVTGGGVISDIAGFACALMHRK